MYQMFHPVFYDRRDRLSFFLQVICYKSWCKPHIFYDDLNLGSYKVDDWDAIIENDDRMDKAALKAILAETTKHLPRNPYSVIPRFIRNVHVHYHNHQKVCIFIF